MRDMVGCSEKNWEGYMFPNHGQLSARHRGTLALLVTGGLCLLLAAAFVRPRSASADSGDISGNGKVASLNLVNQTIQGNIGSITLPAHGAPASSGVLTIGANANGVGVPSVVTANLGVGSGTATSNCDGNPGPGTVEAHCVSRVEGLVLNLVVNLLGDQALSVPFLTAQVIQAEATSTGAGSLSGSAAGSTIVGLQLNGQPIANVSPGTTIPVNITLNTVGGVATGATVTSVLTTLNAAGLDPSVQALLNSVNALLFGADQGLLSSVTNSLGIDATVSVTGSIALNQRTPSGNNVSTTGMDVLMLDANLNVSIALELALTSNVTVAQCTEVFPGLLGLTRCLIANLAGSLLEAIEDLIAIDGVLGTTLQGILNQLGIGFGQTGQLNQNSNATVNIGVIDLEIAQARSAIAGFTVSTPPPGSTSTPVPTATNTPGPGTPTATNTPRPGTPTATNTPRPGTPTAVPTSPAGPGTPTATNTPRPNAPAPTNPTPPGGFATNTPGPSGPPAGIATPRPPATGSATTNGEATSTAQLVLFLAGTTVIAGSFALFVSTRRRTEQ
jgi:hypothetical protein